ncbi:GNAT family N-acetyltransferase, partial [Patescibacteria group bacterium]
NRQLALRKMFVYKNHRGTSVAKKLLDKAFEWAKKKRCTEVYLGTTEKFLAAHRFYEKNGFINIPSDQLPDNFPIMKVDTKFYMKKV